MLEPDDVFHLTAVDVRRYEFQTVMRGYDKTRVDIFKQQVADEMERLARSNQELSDGTGCEPCHFLVSPAGKNDRYLRPQHDSGCVGVGQEGEALGKHVPSLQIGHNKHVGSPRDGRVDLLDRCRFRADRIVERQRPIERRSGDLATVCHLA